MKKISLGGKRGVGRFTLVDDVFYQKLSKYSWYLAKVGYIAARDCSNGKVIYMHRLITDCPKGKIVDHINGNTLDNRIKNLRICTQVENQANRLNLHKNNKMGYRGIHRNSKNTFMSRLFFKGKDIYIGNFKTKEEAAEAYNKIALRLYGKFARLNIF